MFELFAACAACAPHFEKPSLSVVRIELAGGTILQPNLRVTLHVQNPNDRALPIQGISAQLKVGADEIASGSSTHAFVVPANGESDFEMAIKVDAARGMMILANHGDAIAYELTGVVNIDNPLLRSMPFHQNGSFILNAPAR